MDAGQPGPALEVLLLQTVEQAVIATDAEGRIILWNRFAEELYGWSSAEVLGRSVIEVTPSAQTAAQAAEIMASLLRGEHWRGSFEVRRKDGTGFTAMVTNAPIMRDGRMVGVVGLSTDATDRLRAEQALRRSENRLRNLINSIDEGFCVCRIVVDDEGRPVDYVFLEVNPQFEQLTGLHDPVGHSALELVPDLEVDWVRTYGRVALGGEAIRFEQGSRAMGRWFDVYAAPAEPEGHFVLVFQDRTERHQAELALLESEERFRTMADQLPVLVWQHEGMDGQVWVNERFTSYFGVTSRTLGTTAWARHALAGDEDATAAFLRAVEDRAEFHHEVRVVRADGEARWLESRAHPRLAEDGRYLGHLGTSADVTDRRDEAHRQLLRQSRAELAATILAALEEEVDVDAQLDRLPRLLVPALADVAVLERWGVAEPVLAVVHDDASEAERLRAALSRGRTSPRHDGPSVSSPSSRLPACRSTLTVPLTLDRREGVVLTVGVLDEDRRVYDEDDLEFLVETMRRAQLVVAATRLRRREHDVSVRLQRALLPDRLETHPDLIIEARYRAAGDLLEVGGDWYDTFSWPSGEIGVMVGDVVGHSLDSAATMGRLRAATAALAAHVPPSPAALLDALERFARGRDGTTFATATCVVVDPASGRLTYSSAGHPPSLLLAPDGTATLLEGGQTRPLCVGSEPGPQERRPEADAQLEPGSMVVLYSDGLVERRREGLDAGIGRLVSAARALAGLPVAQFADELLGELGADTTATDDVVVACLRYEPRAG